MSINESSDIKDEVIELKRELIQEDFVDDEERSSDLAHEYYKSQIFSHVILPEEDIKTINRYGGFPI